MKKLKVIHPYQLNDLTSYDFRTVSDTDLTGVNFFHLAKDIRQSRLSRGMKELNIRQQNIYVYQSLINNLPNTMNFKEVIIASWNKEPLKESAALLTDKLNVLPTSFSHLQC